MWSGDALVDATVLGETPRFLGPVVGALAVVALNELALRFVLYHNLVPGVLFVMIVITRRLGFTTGADLFFPRQGPCARNERTPYLGGSQEEEFFIT